MASSKTSCTTRLNGSRWTIIVSFLPRKARQPKRILACIKTGDPIRVWSLQEATSKQAQSPERNWKALRSGDKRVVLFESASGKTATIHIPGPGGGMVIAISQRAADPLIAAVHVQSQHERIA